MKKLILAVLMVVMTATPCLAQEIEPEGMFSIEGTLWQAEYLLWLLPIPRIDPIDYEVGFYGGKVYPYLSSATQSFYVDMLVASVYFPAGISGMPLFNRVGILLPQGLGIEISTMLIPVHPPGFSIMLLTKTDDNWTPPEEIVSISPNQGEQGTTLTDIQLTCIDTTFQDDGVGKILFYIPDGLTVSNIDVISNTVIEFDLEIAVDAPVEPRGV